MEFELYQGVEVIIVANPICKFCDKQNKYPGTILGKRVALTEFKSKRLGKKKEKSLLETDK